MKSAKILVLVLLTPLYVLANRDEGFYLLPHFNHETLSPGDRHLLDSGLTIYHSDAEDSTRLNGLRLIAENLYDDVWYEYNIYLDSLLQIRLNAQSSESYSYFYKRLYAEVLNNHGYYFRHAGKPEDALRYFHLSLKVFQEIKDGHGISELYNKVGQIHRDKDESDSAIYFFLKAADNAEAYYDTVGMIMSYNNLGNYYTDFSDLGRAMDYLLEAKDLSEAINYTEAELAIINNISGIYSTLGQEDVSYQYLMESIRLCKKIGNYINLPLLYNNAGAHHFKQKAMDSAMYYYQLGLDMGIEANRPFVIAFSQKNIAGVHESRQQYTQAIGFYEKALKTFLEINDRNQASYVYSSLAEIFLDLGRLKEADEYGQKSLDLAKEIQEIDAIRYASNTMRLVRAEQLRWDEAYEYYRQYIKLRDSAQSQEEANKAIYKELSHEYEKEQALRDAEAKQALLLANEREKRQEMVTFGVAGGFLIVLLLSYFLFDRLKLTQGQKKIIEAQKEEVEEAHQTLEKKNKEIMDSIHYAKRIQQALLKSEEKVSDKAPEHFIFFLPKDIVSGDFYWVMEKDDYLYFSAGDCTGHGVPGAFLTMLGTSYLNEINAGDEAFTPAQILNNLRDKIITELSQSSSEDATKDGMDISLIRLNQKTLELSWTGAHNPLYWVRDGLLNEIKADKQPIGFHEKMTPFSHHELKLQKGDQVYLFTDGFSDQFGGDKGKKYMSKKFREFIQSISSKPLENQKAELETEFNSWKGDHPQLDDVCVIGLRV